MVVVNGHTSFALDRDERVPIDDAGHGHEFVASRAIEVVVVCADQFEAGAAIVKQ
jgi:hypothetical protein